MSQMNYQTPQSQKSNTQTYPWYNQASSSCMYSPTFSNNSYANLSQLSCSTASTSEANGSFTDTPITYNTSPDSEKNYYSPSEFRYQNCSYTPYNESTYQYAQNYSYNNYYYSYDQSYQSDASDLSQMPVYAQDTRSEPDLPEIKSKKDVLDEKVLPYLTESDMSSKRTRHSFSTEEKHYLLGIFKITIYPSRDLIEEMSKKLGKSHVVIQTWFKNTRSKQKKLTN